MSVFADTYLELNRLCIEKKLRYWIVQFVTVV